MPSGLSNGLPNTFHSEASGGTCDQSAGLVPFQPAFLIFLLWRGLYPVALDVIFLNVNSCIEYVVYCLAAFSQLVLIIYPKIHIFDHFRKLTRDVTKKQKDLLLLVMCKFSAVEKWHLRVLVLALIRKIVHVGKALTVCIKYDRTKRPS